MSEEQKFARVNEFNLAMEEEAKATEERIKMMNAKIAEQKVQISEEVQRMAKGDPELVKAIEDLKATMRGKPIDEIAKKLEELLEEWEKK